MSKKKLRKRIDKLELRVKLLELAEMAAPLRWPDYGHVPRGWWSATLPPYVGDSIDIFNITTGGCAI